MTTGFPGKWVEKVCDSTFFTRGTSLICKRPDISKGQEANSECTAANIKTEFSKVESCNAEDIRILVKYFQNIFGDESYFQPYGENCREYDDRVGRSEAIGDPNDDIRSFIVSVARNYCNNELEDLDFVIAFDYCQPD